MENIVKIYRGFAIVEEIEDKGLLTEETGYYAYPKEKGMEEFFAGCSLRSVKEQIDFFLD